jgi:phage-related protein
MITMDDKYRFEDFGFICELGNEDPITPTFSRKTLAIPGRPGVWDFGAEIREKIFSFPLRIFERLWHKREQLFNEFIDFWLDHYGQPREVKIIRDYEPDKFYMVKLAEQINPDRLEDEGVFVLRLVANKPHKRFIVPSNEIIMDSEIPIMSDLLWDTGFSDRKINSPQSFEIINNGSLVIPFSFRMEGSGSNVSITANGKTMTFKNFVNKTLEITDNYVVKVNGISDLTISNGVFLELLPGVNKIYVNGSNLNLTISESLTYQYK